MDEEDYNYTISAPPIEICRSDGNTTVRMDDLTIEVHEDKMDVSADGVSTSIRFDGGSERPPEGVLAYAHGGDMNFVWFARKVAISVSDGYLRTVDFKGTHLEITPSAEVLKERYNASLKRFSLNLCD